MADTIDVTVERHGGIYGFRFHTQAAETWKDEHVESEGWQWWGGMLCLDDKRLAMELAQGMLNDGLTVK